MVSSLGPGKFYGSSLPRPRFYTDVKYNTERVDPPLAVNDALINWANEAHWSMGGLNFTRHRFQGRIEGNVEKLRVQREKQIKAESPKSKKKGVKKGKKKIGESPSPPRAPLALKRRRVLGLVEEDEGEERVGGVRRNTVRKLGDEFERVARESGMDVVEEIEEEPVVVARRTMRSKKKEMVEEKKGNKKKLVKIGDKLAKIGQEMVTKRTSPRLVKN